jgi:hypothetical protein
MTARLAAALMIVGLAACGGGSKDATNTPQTVQSTQQPASSTPSPAQAAQQAAQSVQQIAGATGAAVKPVDSDELKTLLPDLSGYEKKGTRGEQISMGMVASSHAETNYEKGDTSIKLEIQDTALSQMFLAPISVFIAAGYSEKSDDGFRRSATINGSPGFESWDKGAKRAEVTAIVVNRFIVTAKGGEVENTDAVRKIVEAVNFSKLAGMK